METFIKKNKLKLEITNYYDMVLNMIFWVVYPLTKHVFTNVLSIREFFEGGWSLMMLHEGLQINLLWQGLAENMANACNSFWRSHVLTYLLAIL